MKKEGFAPNKLENLSCPSSAFSTYDVENLKALPILVQSGYLTISEYDKGMDLYTLAPPNREVRQSFYDALLAVYSFDRDSTPLYQLMKALKINDLETFFDNLDILFAKIPYDIHLKYEKYWQSLFYMIFTLMDYYIEAE